MLGPKWEYKTHVGAPLSGADLAALGDQHWELVAVLPPKVATVPLRVRTLDPGYGTVFAQYPVVYEDNTYMYFFKRPI